MAKIALAQVDATLGDVSANLAVARDSTRRAAAQGADLVVFPELEADLLDVIEYWGELLRCIARLQQCWVVFCNRVGTEAGARFWGGSRVLDPGGQVAAAAPLWEPGLILADIDVAAARRRRHELPLIAEARLGLIAREVVARCSVRI